MSEIKLSPSLIAVAISQAFFMTPCAHAQTTEKPLPEVTITGSKMTDVKAERSKVSGFIDTALIDTPYSVNAVTQSQMQDWQVRQTTDAMKFDASVNDAYNAVGYSEQFSIRGFALDNSSSYRKDGFAIPADASIPLENKERIDILKGIAGFQAGFATPGGIINYVTKRPASAPLRSASFEISERGTLYGAADISDNSSDKQFGFRLNAAGERLRSYVKGANGEREFFSAAFDWHITPQALLQIDMDYQHKSQLTVPGFQLFNGTDLPRGISADMMLNAQPWAKPVDTRDSNVGLHFEYQINNSWHATLAANKHEFRRNDFTAFPYGCSPANLSPGYCVNGDYDVYDYQSTNESKSLWGTQAILNGKFNTAGMQNELAVGLSNSQRRDYFGDYVYDLVGTSNLFNPVNVPPSQNKTGPVFLRRTDKEWSVFAQDIISLQDNVKLHLGLRHLHISRIQFDNPGYDQGKFLTTAALVYKPSQAISVYGSYAQGLEHGGIAPTGTSNVNQMLDPSRSTQLEFGVKTELRRDLNVSAAIFRIKKPLEYIDTNNTYVSRGEALHTGLELSAQGKVMPQLNIGFSLTALDAKQQDTGLDSLDGKRVMNVPRLKSSVYVDYAVADVKGLNLNATWQYASSKAFSPDNSVTVPGYHVIDLGARYATQIGYTATTLRFNIDNAFNKFYWRDVTQSLGGYLFPGAPRTYKLSAQFDF